MNTFYQLLLFSIIIFINFTNAQVPWEKINSPSIDEIRAMAISNDGNIYLSDDRSGIYKSDDLGVTWDEIFFSGIYSILYREMIVGVDDHLYVAARNYLLVMDQMGNPVYSKYFNTDTYSLALNSQLQLYVATEDSGIARTTNQGETWEVNILLPDSGYHFTSVAIDDSDNIFVGTSVGVFKSSDNGSTWIQKNVGLIDLYVFDIMCTSNGYLYLTGNYGIARSTNGGQNWEYVNNGSGGRAVEIKEDGYSNLYFGSQSADGAIYESSNWGQNWEKIYQTNAGSNASVLLINNILFIGSFYSGFYSADLSDSSLTTIALVPTSIHNFVENGIGEYFALYENIGVSTDFGRSWRTLVTPWYPFVLIGFWNVPNINIFTGAAGQIGIIKNREVIFYWALENFDYSFPNTVLYEPDSNYIYVSTTTDYFEFYGGVYRGKYDTNSTILEKVTTGLPAYPSTVLLAQNSKNQLFAAVDGNGVYRSNDRGLTWQIKNNGLTDLHIRIIKIDHENNIYAITSSEIFRSTDDGESWYKLINNHNYYIIDLDIDSLNNLYMAVSSQIFKSTDHGVNWFEFGNSFVYGIVNGIFINDSSYLYVYTNNGVYRSPDPITNASEYNEHTLTSFLLHQNYPNPFNPITNIEYQIPNPGFVSLKIYDVLGNEITNLVSEEKPAGIYSVEFNGIGFPSGVYFYKLQAGNFSQVKKMILLR